MSVLKTGTYKTDSGDFTLEITSKDDSAGTFVMSYTSPFQGKTDAASQTVGGSGGYKWVYNEGEAGTAPFPLTFTAGYRPSDWSTAFWESWSGYYLDDNTIIASGCTTYVKGKSGEENSEAETTCLGSVAFYLQTS